MLSNINKIFSKPQNPTGIFLMIMWRLSDISIMLNLWQAMTGLDRQLTAFWQANCLYNQGSFISKSAVSSLNPSGKKMASVELLFIALHMLLASATGETWDYRDFTLVDHYTGKSQHSDMFHPSILSIVCSCKRDYTWNKNSPETLFLKGFVIEIFVRVHGQLKKT